MSATPGTKTTEVPTLGVPTKTLGRDFVEPSPGSVRRADAQNASHCDRRPAPAPRPCLSDHRRKRAPIPGHGR
jgi:hypothetical protein